MSKVLVASAIGIKMDEKEEFFFSDTYLMTNFQFQPFLFNPTGKAPPTRGRYVLKKDKKIILLNDFLWISSFEIDLHTCR